MRRLFPPMQVDKMFSKDEAAGNRAGPAPLCVEASAFWREGTGTPLLPGASRSAHNGLGSQGAGDQGPSR